LPENSRLLRDRFRKSKSQGRSLGSVADYHYPYPSGFDAGLKFNYGSYVTVINPDQSGEPGSGQGRRLVCSGGFMVRTLDFTMARLDHLEWKRKLKSSLDDCGKPAEGQAISHEDCELGKWLYLCGLEKYGRFSLMWELERTHEELHSIAKSIIRMRDSGDRIGARQEFSKMGPISDKVIDLLMEVEKQVAGS
jgi:hypothetical protein